MEMVRPDCNVEAPPVVNFAFAADDAPLLVSLNTNVVVVVVVAVENDGVVVVVVVTAAVAMDIVGMVVNITVIPTAATASV